MYVSYTFAIHDSTALKDSKSVVENATTQAAAPVQYNVESIPAKIASRTAFNDSTAMETMLSSSQKETMLSSSQKLQMQNNKIHNTCSQRTPVIWSGDCIKFFLSSSIPNHYPEILTI